MIEILFFAQVREIIGTSALQLQAEFPTVDCLRNALMARGDRWALALESGKLLVAVNQTLTNMAHPLKAGDEVAFFPPVTGG
ncbi:molybdopterin synthase sulfur carrier subunit [Enterobacteriaceae bacterium Kacie_13]|nr:molybdopterin synthase sulfur carrier subunit [Enterobacteriaceae bacterium Kacie_13]